MKPDVEEAIGRLTAARTVPNGKIVLVKPDDLRTLLDAYASREAEVMEAGRMREALETIADNCSAFMLSSDPGDIIPAECGVIARAALSPEPEAKET